ncbi:MAG: fimbrial assembly protein [Pseudomonadota bacterium]
MAARKFLPRACGRRARRQTGMFLIEVLVSVVLLSIALMAMVMAQARVSQVSADAEDRNRAALLANEIASTMWQIRTVNLAASTVAAWQGMVASNVTYQTASTQSPGGSGLGGLPNGVGTVVVDAATNIATITITWQAPAHGASAAVGSQGQSRYVTQVVLP